MDNILEKITEYFLFKIRNNLILKNIKLSQIFNLKKVFKVGSIYNL